eukprot:comp10097_c0_seq1/m.11986 comp10097_c0_seq1/g.11986  ORF comp10097_c0_seq1/g.11986 comp10097_c0_seq1/m.11986 type:complete len:137 (-) comp10097_c0_seq1:15-425(-)
MIACVAIVSKQNSPLYLRSFGSTDGFRFHYIIHTSLDMIEEKSSKGKGSGGSDGSFFLGLLYPIEDFQIYGYITNTKVKMILVLDDNEAKDSEVHQFFKQLHSLYIGAIFNPFHDPDARIESKLFDQKVISLVRQS